MNSTVFAKGSQQVQKVLSENSPKNVLIVPIDFAKKKHVAKICDASGVYLHQRPITLYNNAKGVSHIVDRIEKACSRKHVKKSHVIIACEDPHSYAKPFFQRLKDLGYFVVQVNAHRAKVLRAHSMASSDAIDLDGIANAVINRRAIDLKGQEATYEALQRASRSYHADVKHSSRMKNQLNKLMDQLFPGFLSKQQSGLEPYGNASLALMRKGITVRKLKAMSTKRLTVLLQRYHINNIPAVTHKLRNLTSESFEFDCELETSYVELFKAKLKLFEALQQTIQETLKICKKLLLKTPYCLLMSIPGIAEVRAITLAAEYAEPGNLPKSKSMCAYAGIVPRTEQSGGPDKAAFVKGLPKKCNRRLKNAVLSAAFDQGRFSHPVAKQLPEYGRHRLQRHFLKIDARGGKSGISTAKLLIKISRRMVRDNSLYLPQENHPSPIDLAMYVETSITTIYNYFGTELFNSVPKEENILRKVAEEWRQTMKVFHDIELNLPF
jgi:transposase